MSSIYRASTIADLIEVGGDGTLAIGAPGRAFLGHRGLRELTRRTIHWSQCHGHRLERPGFDGAFRRAAAIRHRRLNPACRSMELDGPAGQKTMLCETVLGWVWERARQAGCYPEGNAP
jgi:hypothetical protein